MTQLSGASLVSVVDSGVDVNKAVAVAAPPAADLADADRFWERHEGARLRVRAGAARPAAAMSSPAPPTPRSG